MLSYRSGISTSINLRECENYKFSEHTTYGLGGLAKICYEPKNLVEAKLAVDKCLSSSTQFKVVGNGSNILASDSGFDGAVISTAKLQGIVRLKTDNLLYCLSGTKISTLLNYCKINGLGGLEYLYGIPATIGGAAYMNAGVGNFCIGNNVSSVIVYNGKKDKFNAEKCNFAYRHSTMRDITVLILAVIVKTYPQSQQEIESKINYFKQRRAHLPKGKSCGCVFKNTKEYSAGLLIEKAGLKGKSIGGAIVSPIHANFIINRGNCAKDVKDLIDLVKSQVFKAFNVKLCEEVVYIGEFNDFNG